MFDNIMLGPGVVIASSNHTYIEDTIRFGGHEKRKITIGKEVWIGANSTIIPGVDISDNVIVAAGSVLTKNIEKKCCIVGGVPAKYLKNI